MDKDYRFFLREEINFNEIEPDELYCCSNGIDKAMVYGRYIKDQSSITHVFLPKKPLKIAQFSYYLATVDYKDKSSHKPEGALPDKLTVHAFAAFSDGGEIYFKLAESEHKMIQSNLKIHCKIGAIQYQLAEKKSNN